MKKFILFLTIATIYSFSGLSQNGYDIKVNFKGCKDSMVYLVKYTWDQQYLVDTCKKIKNGQKKNRNKIRINFFKKYRKNLLTLLVKIWIGL